MRTHLFVNQNRVKNSVNLQRGSSLLEVMIALFVLAIGLLGTLAMQATSVKYNQNSYAFSQAINLANDVVERIRAKKPADNTDTEVTTWQTMVGAQLPGGVGAVTFSTPGDEATVTISFYDYRALDGKTGTDSSGNDVRMKTHTLTARL